MNKRTVYTKSHSSGSGHYHTYPISLPREPWNLDDEDAPYGATIVTRERAQEQLRKSDVGPNT